MGTEELKRDPDTGVYWKDGDDTPYCPNCIEGYVGEFHLYPDMGGTPYQWHCKECGNYYPMT